MEAVIAINFRSLKQASLFLNFQKYKKHIEFPLERQYHTAKKLCLFWILLAAIMTVQEIITGRGILLLLLDICLCIYLEMLYLSPSISDQKYTVLLCTSMYAKKIGLRMKY